MWLSWFKICLQRGRRGFDPWVGKIPWRRERLPSPVLWPREFHGLYSPGWGTAKSRTRLSDFHFQSQFSHSVMSDSLQHHGPQPTKLLCPWGFPRQEYWSGLTCPPPGDLPNPGIEPRSLELQVDSLLPEPPGKPKNTGVGSLSLLQEIFPTQELNWDLLHCRWILY